jgi:NAD(P)-dependent dehydrogenase (short-subunit alcohol dehydrogenase family)
MTSKPTVLIFGIGPRTGNFITNKFADAGYQVAATGRSIEEGPIRNGWLGIKADLANPAVVTAVFAKSECVFSCSADCRCVRRYIIFLLRVSTAGSCNPKPSPIEGKPPTNEGKIDQLIPFLHCVAYSSTKCDLAHPFSIPVSDLQHDLTVNIASLYAASAEAVKGSTKILDHVSKTFIFVGNKQNHFVFPPLVSLGMGKCAAAHLMENAAKALGELPYMYVLSLLII